jgi:uncharacterized peroxidase-related enzyme
VYPEPEETTMTPRIPPVAHETATGRARELLDAVKAKLGVVPNLTRVMAASPPVLEGYLGLSGALARPAALSARAKEQLALAVGEANGCEYCVSAHSFLGQKAGLSPREVTNNRRGTSDDTRTAALLTFARRVLDRRGRVEDADLEAVRAAGFGDAEIAEAVAHVALNVFTNFLNNVAHTPIDFPKAAPLDGGQA